MKELKKSMIECSSEEDDEDEYMNLDLDDVSSLDGIPMSSDEEAELESQRFTFDNHPLFSTIHNRQNSCTGSQKENRMSNRSGNGTTEIPTEPVDQKASVTIESSEILSRTITTVPAEVPTVAAGLPIAKTEVTNRAS